MNKKNLLVTIIIVVAIVGLIVVFTNSDITGYFVRNLKMGRNFILDFFRGFGKISAQGGGGAITKGGGGAIVQGGGGAITKGGGGAISK